MVLSDIELFELWINMKMYCDTRHSEINMICIRISLKVTDCEVPFIPVLKCFCCSFLFSFHILELEYVHTKERLDRLEFISEMPSSVGSYTTQCSEMKQRCLIGHRPYNSLLMCLLIRLESD